MKRLFIVLFALLFYALPAWAQTADMTPARQLDFLIKMIFKPVPEKYKPINYSGEFLGDFSFTDGDVVYTLHADRGIRGTPSASEIPLVKNARYRRTYTDEREAQNDVAYYMQQIKSVLGEPDKDRPDINIWYLDGISGSIKYGAAILFSFEGTICDFTIFASYLSY